MTVQKQYGDWLIQRAADTLFQREMKAADKVCPNCQGKKQPHQTICTKCSQEYLNDYAND